MRSKRLHVILLTAMMVLGLAGCGTTQTVPITGRQHKIAVSDQALLQESRQEYAAFMAKNKKSTDAASTAMVQRVGRRLANAVETYLKQNGYASEIKNYEWEFNLVQNKEANAWCMPGGKIVVYEGLLPITQNETSLAIVLGHEIAHAVAKHSAEQMTKAQNQNIGIQLGGALLGAVAGSDVANVAANVASNGFQLLNLKYSRQDELEADHMGLIFAAMAGYDPQQAIPFWKRMAGNSGNGSSGSYTGASTSDFLSTHPSDAKRIAALEQEMPEALKYYKQSSKAVTTKKTTSRKSSSRKRR
ncbi:M48 family metallopeptidase [Prevotella sp. AGR2160]|uniref:M48 family metallopeptidase n=1 Tax=Prevotella sp. AGR2160 TaxID=1280674 RepID=UPI00048EEDA4|nr:M48 family metalloprotease [Prevotella sp. AGR2160]